MIEVQEVVQSPSPGQGRCTQKSLQREDLLTLPPVLRVVLYLWIPHTPSRPDVSGRHLPVVLVQGPGQGVVTPLLPHLCALATPRLTRFDESVYNQ